MLKKGRLLPERNGQKSENFAWELHACFDANEEGEKERQKGSNGLKFPSSCF